MAETVEFQKSHEYSLRENGIPLTVELFSGNLLVKLTAKIDTGSTYCIFQRHKGEGLDLDIESGIPADIGTAGGFTFRVYGHEVTMKFLGIEFVSTVFFAESQYFDRNVLGRTGWLDKVKLGLVDREAKLFLSKYTDDF